jgi:hypothetical protein
VVLAHQIDAINNVRNPARHHERKPDRVGRPKVKRHAANA